MHCDEPDSFFQNNGLYKCQCTRIPVSVGNTVDSSATEYASIDSKVGKNMLAKIELELKKPTVICGQDMTCFTV